MSGADEVATEFKRSRHGELSMRLDDAEIRILRHVLTETLELLGPPEPPDDDPLAAAVGIGTTTTAPEDPALARLFPNAYTDDPAASADFRRYTEPGLREAKREAARTALATLDEARDHRRVLTEAEAMAWLGTLNDMRLVLGDRLGVTEDWEAMVEDLDQGDPRLTLFWVYDRLTYLQDVLVRALM
ncbi:MAG: DUF2017 domain-containing protein [Actinomycetes bacterium]